MKQDSKQPHLHPLSAKSTFTWFKLENWRVTIFFTLEEENLNLPKFDFILKTLLSSSVSCSNYVNPSM